MGTHQWARVGLTLMKAGLPVLGGLIAGPAGAAGAEVAVSAIDEVARTLGVSPKPDAIEKALQENPEAALKLAQIEADIRREEVNGAVAIQTKRLEREIAETAKTVENYSTVNETMRLEESSEDAYVRHMRPTYGYMLTATMAALGLAIAIDLVIAGVRSTGDLVLVLKALGELAAGSWEIVAAALAVLGIYVRSRSTYDKPIEAGLAVPTEGWLSGFINRVRRK